MSARRRLPPLAVSGVALLLLLTLLPSALNVPQTDPATTPEYAPVPPEDGAPPAVGGNFGGLALAGSDSISEDAPGGDATTDDDTPGTPPPTRPGGGGNRPANVKKCVGDPPRQTEDPLSPPCVGYFQGDNGGSTYPGVSGEEIRVLVTYTGGNTRPTSEGNETSPTEGCFDLFTPSDDDDVFVRFQRTLQRYFNDRYQLYGRTVRGFVCWVPSSGSPEERRSQAAEHYKRVQPFAVLNYVFSNAEAYGEYFLRRGVLNFGAEPFTPAAQFTNFPKLTWGYLPSAEEQAIVYANYVCSKLVRNATSFSGNAGENGTPRRFGLLYTADPAYPGLRIMADRVRERVEACGGDIVSEATYPNPYGIFITTERPNYGQDNMLQFRTDNVTTILWTGGWEDRNSRGAAAIGYRPEWVVAGDLQFDGYDIGQLQDQGVWGHAVMVSPITRVDTFEQGFCFQALREADPSYPRQDAEYACPLSNPYESLRQLFTGIQVAGSRLGPTTIDRGFRAIPAVASADPRVPACYYRPGDYTCVKDAMQVYWDTEARARNNRPGCWRMPEGGRRYLADEWSKTDPLQDRHANDVCNGYAASALG